MPTTKRELEYISEAAAELAEMADSLGLATLSYIFRMAEMEADSAAPTADSTSDGHRPRNDH
jgi:hypothetical protein